MSGIEAKGLLQVLQEGAQSVLSSGAAVLSDLQQQLSTAAKQQQQKQGWTPLGSSHSSHSSSSFSRRLLEWKEETVAHLRWSTPLLQVHWGIEATLAGNSSRRPGPKGFGAIMDFFQTTVSWHSSCHRHCRDTRPPHTHTHSHTCR
jgi:hypothetical protein